MSFVIDLEFEIDPAWVPGLDKLTGRSRNSLIRQLVGPFRCQTTILPRLRQKVCSRWSRPREWMLVEPASTKSLVSSSSPETTRRHGGHNLARYDRFAQIPKSHGPSGGVSSLRLGSLEAVCSSRISLRRIPCQPRFVCCGCLLQFGLQLSHLPFEPSPILRSLASLCAR